MASYEFDSDLHSKLKIEDRKIQEAKIKTFRFNFYYFGKRNAALDNCLTRDTIEVTQEDWKTNDY